jgi:small-conductance mechanosensitive channel
MPTMDELREQVLGDTPLRDALVALAVAAVVTLTTLLVRSLVVRRMRRLAERTATRVDDVVLRVLDRTRWYFLVALGLWFGARYIELSDDQRHAVNVVMALLMLFQLGLWLDCVIRSVAEVNAQRRVVDTGSRNAVAALSFVARVIVWSLLFVTALSSLGFEIGALVAGLGIGGVAAALAVQNVLGDLLASLSIFFDRPFDVGDFVVIGNEKGTVERIGVRSTQIRALDGQQVVIPNSDLAKSRISNFKRLDERRIVFSIGVEYATPADELERIPLLAKEIISSRPGLRFDRAHFKAFGAFSLDFEIVYFVLSPDYAVYMDHQHAINLALLRALKERNVEFAYPTNTVFVRPGQGWPS